MQAKLQLGSEAPSRTFKTNKSLTTDGLTHYYTPKTIGDPLKFPSTFVVAYRELASYSSPLFPATPDNIQTLLQHKHTSHLHKKM